VQTNEDLIVHHFVVRSQELCDVVFTVYCMILQVCNIYTEVLSIN